MMNANTYKLKTSQKAYRTIKAVMDFIIALIALIVLSPLFIVVAIAIKVDSPGPVFFVQKRIGKGGKLFNCIKFRSMSIDARHDIAGYEYENAKSYVTKTGAFIRKFSIDELPQLFNILTLKMSLIGFRPSQENETELNDARESYNLYQVRPGISGWAQINGRDILAANPKKKAKYDAYYLEHFSLGLDIKIFFITIVKVFKSDDVAEGVIKTPQDGVDEESVVIGNEAASADSITKELLDDKETNRQKEVV